MIVAKTHDAETADQHVPRINIPVVALSFSVIFFGFRPPKNPKAETVTQCIKKLDLIGCAIFVPSVFMLLFAMQQGGQGYSWNSPAIIGLFVGAGVTMLLFVGWEWHRGNEAMIPPNVVSRRTVSFAVLFAFCHMGSLTVATYYLAEWFQVVEGVDALQSGVRYLPTVGTQLLMTIVASSLGECHFHDKAATLGASGSQLTNLLSSTV